MINLNELLFPGYEILGVTPVEDKQRQTKLIVKVKPHSSTIGDTCPQCNKKSLVGHGHRSVTIHDFVYLEPVGKIYSMKVEYQRKRCKICGVSLQDKASDLPGVHPKYSTMTERLYNLIYKEAMMPGISIGKVVNDYSLHRDIVHKIFHEALDEEYEKLALSGKLNPKRVIGVDGVYLIKEEVEVMRWRNGKLVKVRVIKKTAQFTIVNLEEQKPIALLDNDDEVTIKEYFTNSPTKNDIEYVVIDMSAKYRKCIREILPWVIILIDRFHVDTQCNKIIDMIRKRISREGKLSNEDRLELLHVSGLLKIEYDKLKKNKKNQLNRVFRKQPELKEAYILLHGFCAIYKHKEEKDARKAYAKWLKKLKETETQYPKLYKTFQKIVKMMKKWGKEIFNYFKYPHRGMPLNGKRPSNGGVESMNRLFKDEKRRGRQSKVDTIRKKVICNQFYEVESFSRAELKEIDEDIEKKKKKKKRGD